jgi:hypothetical protein
MTFNKFGSPIIRVCPTDSGIDVNKPETFMNKSYYLTCLAITLFDLSHFLVGPFLKL